MTIAEVSKKYSLSADTLRYYERIGLIPGIQKNKSGIRDYTENDMRWVEFAKCMRGAGLPIEALIKYVTLFLMGDETLEARKALLIGQRDRLAAKILEMQNTLDRLNGKIERFEQSVLKAEQRLARPGL
jgi:DNA-binding transcriptional MerR regulator